MTQHLKVTATVRFDRNGNPYCLDRCFARLISPFPDLQKGLSIPYNESIDTGVAHAFYGIEPVISQPRLSLAYNPGWSRNTVFRGGIDLFSDLYSASFVSNVAGNPPNIFVPVIHTGLINAGGPGSAPAIEAATVNAFESGFASGATLTQLQRVVAPASFNPPGYYSIPLTVRSPKSLQWSFGLEQQFGVHSVLTMRYMGNYGYDIFLINPNANANADPAFYPHGFAGLPTAAPDPRFSVAQQLGNNAYSNYNALLINFRRAFAHGFQGQISYTWSHALDTISNGGLLSFSLFESIMGQIESLNYSNADYDVRHNATGDFIWEMPLKLNNRFMNTIFGRWSVGTKLIARTGSPFSVINSTAFPSASFGGVVLADVIAPNTRTVCGRSAIDTPCFSASQFAPAATQANLGNLPRNSFRGPGFFDIDSSLFKTVLRSERMRLMLGASAYNVLNHPNFDDPNWDVAKPGLGLITSTVVTPSSPYGFFGGPSGRALVITGKLVF